MEIGIVGLPNSTKTTIFNALTHSQIETAITSSGKAEVNQAMVEVPDQRIEQLVEMFNPRKISRARVQYNDIAGLRIGIGTEGGLEGELLNTLARSSALLHVIRAFKDDKIPHPSGSVDPIRDLKALEFEFVISDLDLVERRLERLYNDLSRKGNYLERKIDLAERDLLEKIKAGLEHEIPVRELGLNPTELKMIRGFQLLTAKPVLIVLSVGDDGSIDPGDYPIQTGKNQDLVCIRGSLEMEIAQLDEEEALAFLQEYEIDEPGLNRMIRLSYQLLGLESFFTVGEDEVKAWTIPRGASALDAAGVIHSDLARGFIRAEVISCNDLLEVGGLSSARKQGKLRLEGKDYPVQDGDVLTIRFNI